MNAMDIIGYAFDGAEYCTGCATDGRFSAERIGCTCDSRDAYGLCDSNCHGYGPNPIFGDAGEAGPCDACGGEILETDASGYLPQCVLAMGCYCAGHARGNPTDAPCDTSEVRPEARP